MRFKELDDTGQKLARRIFSGKYMMGLCVAFAIAIQRKLRYGELYGIFRGDELMHAGNRSNGMFFDVRGFMRSVEFTDGWSGCDVRLTTEEELLRCDPKITEELIRKAEFELELMYPAHCLNKRESQTRDRIRKFTEDLEKLCKRHGVYIRGELPHEGPIIYEAYGDEKGFEVQFMETGQMRLRRLLDD